MGPLWRAAVSLATEHRQLLEILGPCDVFLVKWKLGRCLRVKSPVIENEISNESLGWMGLWSQSVIPQGGKGQFRWPSAASICGVNG